MREGGRHWSRPWVKEGEGLKHGSSAAQKRHWEIPAALPLLVSLAGRQIYK